MARRLVAVAVGHLEPDAFAFLVATTLLSLVPGVAAPMLVRIFVDQVLTTGATEWAPPVILGLAVSTAVAGAVSALQYRLLARSAIRLSATGSARFAWHALRLPVPVADRLGTGDVSARGAATQGLALKGGMLVPRAVVGNILSLVVLGAALVALDPRLGLTALVVVAVSMVISARALGGRALRQREANEARVALAARTSELIESIETVKASAAEAWLFDRWGRARDAAGLAVGRLGAGGQHMGVVAPITKTAGLVLVLAVGSFLVTAGQLTVGTLVASQGLLMAVLVPAGQLVWLGVNRTSVAALERQIGKVLELPLDPETAGEPPQRTAASAPDPGPLTPGVPVGVALRDVVFGYDPSGPAFLDGISLEVAPGSRVALVGGSGSGKSTIVRLVTGELQPWSGEVLVAGTPRLALPRPLRTGLVGYVPQTSLLVAGSLRENITLFDDEIPFAVVEAAVRDACVEAAVESRPLAYEEPVEAGTAGFSGGELQRLAIARALCRRPSILVLDEATSALDPVVEEELEGRLRARGCTTLVVAHRLSTVRDADLIIVLDRGRIVQSGRYDDIRGEGLFGELTRG